MRRHAHILAAATALACAGCVELDGVLEVKPDGSAVTRTEVRLETKIVRDLDRGAAKAKRKRPAPPADETKSFAEMCASLADPLERASGTPPLPLAAISTTAVTTRGKWTICTLTETIPEPAGYYTDIASQLGLSDEKFERLETGDGYRYVSALRMRRLLAAMDAQKDDRQALAEIRKLVPASATLAFTITSARISDTDGRVAADGRSVRWSYPLRRLLDQSATAPPLAARAIIHYR